jgi:hypothetical protein
MENGLCGPPGRPAVGDAAVDSSSARVVVLTPVLLMVVGTVMEKRSKRDRATLSLVKLVRTTISWQFNISFLSQKYLNNK